MTAATIDHARIHVARPAPKPIPFRRLLQVETIKMFDTRAGFWLMVSIAASALIATVSVIAFAPDSALTYDNFGAAIGIPMALLLPVMAILSVTSEWSQRSGLTTFTLVPHRGRVIRAKLVVSVVLGAVSFAVALAIGALGNIVGSGIAGVDTVWDISASQMATLVLANVLNLLIGFMLGVLIRNSPGAIVGYVVYNFVLPTLSLLLANTQDWWKSAQPWLDFSYAQGPLYEGGLSSTEWANLGVTSLVWLVVPLAVGLALVRRSEVK
jgi:ABC-2 type transport system permease protein